MDRDFCHEMYQGANPNPLELPAEPGGTTRRTRCFTTRSSSKCSLPSIVQTWSASSDTCSTAAISSVDRSVVALGDVTPTSSQVPGMRATNWTIVARNPNFRVEHA